MNLIEFHARPYELKSFPKPYPATRAVPEWYKNLPAESENELTLNRYDTPLIFFSGVVETDTYYQEVHFPFICQLASGHSFTLRAGLPLMQVIPFHREAWESQILPVDPQRDAAAIAEMTANRHAY